MPASQVQRAKSSTQYENNRYWNFFMMLTTWLALERQKRRVRRRVSAMSFLDPLHSCGGIDIVDIIAVIFGAYDHSAPNDDHSWRGE
jgi:hypothetical protein